MPQDAASYPVRHVALAPGDAKTICDKLTQNINGRTTMARIIGTASSDDTDGTRFADLIRGLQGNDDIEGRRGNDRIFGGFGRDEIEGDGGNDMLQGDAGNDDLEGENGDDWLLGGTGRDDLDGSDGDDRLSGGYGNDTLSGDEGNDFLIGGVGRDVFDFDGDDDDDDDGGNGRDVIADWTDGQDRIDVADYDFTLRGVLATGTQRGANVRFDFDDQSVLIVRNADLDDFTAADFIL